MINGETVSVLRRQNSGLDDFGAPIYQWVEETYENVLFSPNTTEDLGAERPEGVKKTVNFSFPKKANIQSLKGCRIIRANSSEYEVIGDPQAYMSDNCPTIWNLTVQAVMVDG